MLTGSRARPDLGPYFFEPTILEGVTPDMTCFGRETFGPAISLYRFHDEGEAVARANDGGPHPVRDGQHQRGLRRDLRQRRLPDGRHAPVGDGSSPGQ
ncbi:MAG: aldehyde dehydrogenase family protein [Nocardioides sp.]